MQVLDSGLTLFQPLTLPEPSSFLCPLVSPSSLSVKNRWGSSSEGGAKTQPLPCSRITHGVFFAASSDLVAANDIANQTSPSR